MRIFQSKMVLGEGPYKEQFKKNPYEERIPGTHPGGRPWEEAQGRPPDIWGSAHRAQLGTAQ